MTRLYVVTPSGVNSAFSLMAFLLWGLSAWFLFRTVGAITPAQSQLASITGTFD